MTVRITMTAAAISFAVAFAPAAHASGVFVYPAKGQSEEQTDKDKGECYQWGVKQTGYDPARPAEVPKDTGPGVLGGAAGGAALGAIGGAIAGSPATGAAIGAAVGGIFGGVKSSDAKRKAEERQQAAYGAWRKAYTACLEGRGYTVQ